MILTSFETFCASKSIIKRRISEIQSENLGIAPKQKNEADDDDPPPWRTAAGAAEDAKADVRGCRLLSNASGSEKNRSAKFC